MKKMPKQAGSFMKGGLRYTKLAKKVPALSPGEPIRWWFIATSAGARRQVQATASLLFSKESIVAVTDTSVIVAPLKGPGVFSSTLSAAAASKADLDSVEASFDAKSAKITIDQTEMSIFSGHSYEALQVAAACGAQMPDWFVAA